MTSTTHGDGVFRHELVLHDGTAELVDLMVPFIRDGAAAGDKVVVIGERPFVETLVAAVPEVDDLDVEPERAHERYPGRDLHRARRMLERLGRAAPRVRVVNQMPASAHAQWNEWRRYEAAVNVVLSPYRAWGTCAYDTTAMDDDVLSDLRASHPFVLTPGGRHRSADFDERGAYTSRFLDVPRHPIEDSEPTLAMVGPAPAAARRAVHDLAGRAGLSPTARETAILATSEAVTNGWVHGEGPVVLRVWAGAGRLTVAVSDGGRGPHPLVGMLPEHPDSHSGRGMWMIHLLLGDVRHRTGDDGYTVTFSV